MLIPGQQACRLSRKGLLKQTPTRVLQSTPEVAEGVRCWVKASCTSIAPAPATNLTPLTPFQTLCSQTQRGALPPRSDSFGTTQETGWKHLRCVFLACYVWKLSSGIYYYRKAKEAWERGEGKADYVLVKKEQPSNDHHLGTWDLSLCFSIFFPSPISRKEARATVIFRIAEQRNGSFGEEAAVPLDSLTSSFWLLHPDFCKGQ